MENQSRTTVLGGSERPRHPQARLIGPLGPNELVAVTLVVRPRPGSPPMPDLAHWQRTPPGKRRFLTPDEFAKTYGASQADLDTVGAFVAAHGMQVLDSHCGRRNVTVQGTAAQMKAAFGVQLNSYEAPLPPPAPKARTPEGRHLDVAAMDAAGTQIHHGYDGAVHVPAELAGIVTAVVGLDNRMLAGPAGTPDPGGAGYNPVPTVARLYNFPNPGAADQVIGIIAPQATPGNGASYLLSDINNLYFPGLAAGYQTPPASVNDVNLTVGAQTYSNSPATVQGITAATNTNNFPYSFILEITQDICTSSTIAQGATVNVYFTQNTEQGWLVFLNRVLQPQGEKQPTVVSCSWVMFFQDDVATIGSIATPGSIASVVSSLFQQLAIVGINVFIAAGDWGADDAVTDGTRHVMYPASDPWVTSCGGTVVGQPAPPAFVENVWSDAFSNSQFGSNNSDFGATGGGVSANFPVPAYQTAAGITQMTDSQNNVAVGRVMPDIAGMVGYSGFFTNGVGYGFVGTSCVAPLYAGLFAVLRSAFKLSLGFLNPTLYQLGPSGVFNDVTSGNNDSGDTPDSPFFTAAAGFDACTGWGSVDGTKLLNAMASQMYTQTFYFAVEKNTYGFDEVGTQPNYPLAFWLVLEGYTGSAAAGIAMPPTVTGQPNGITITVNQGQPEIPSQMSTPQRILYPCSLTFTPGAIQTTAQGGVFPAPGAAPNPMLLTAQVTIQGQTFQPESLFQFVAGANPYFVNINPAQNNVFYLSQDLRVFAATPGISNTPIAGAGNPPPLSANSTTGIDTSAGFTYITNLIAYLNANYSNPAGVDPFNTMFPDQSSALSGDSSVTPNTIDPSNPNGPRFTNYNFGIARVRLNGTPNTSSVKNVRVFFRLFVTQTNDTDFQPSTYPSNPDAAGFPGAPLVANGNVTVPFFATGNYENNPDFAQNVDYSANSVNNQPISIGASGSVWAYYGCYLNVYQPANTVGGQSVPAVLAGTHHCLVAEIAFDDAPIVNSNGITMSPDNSDKLAQRNLQFTQSDNPGGPETHRVPQTFDLRPTAMISSTPGELLDYPDELMIDWGNTPVGTKAQIYWPQVNASDVLALAQARYSTHQLSAVDPNTIECTVTGGMTYVPIPLGSGDNFAGLFTLDLPQTVITGQEFDIIVRRLATRGNDAVPRTQTPARAVLTGAPVPTGAAAPAGVTKQDLVRRNWRYVVGTFGVRIPVSTPALMLPIDEDTFAIMKWRLAQMSPSNRWHPVLLRYISYLAARIEGLGGNPGLIQPSPYGAHGTPEGGQERHELTGRIVALKYDRRGELEEFTLRHEDHQRHFRVPEGELEAVIRLAWEQQVKVTVVVPHKHSHHVVAIVLHRPESRFWRFFGG